MENSEISLVEFHDSRVSEVSIGRGNISIVFEHLAVYRRGGGGLDEVWSYAARLDIVTATGLRVEGILPDRGWVSSDEIEVRDNSDGTQIALLRGCQNGFIRFGFDNGTKIEIEGGSAVVVLLKQQHLIETVERD